MWKLAYKWARHCHPNKPRHWVTARYFGQFNKSRQDNWVFGDRVSGAHIVKFAWTKIVRHQMVKGGASPDDPTLAVYWAERRRKGTALPIDRTGMRLLQAQQGRCPLCGTLLLHADHPPQNPHEWELWLAATRRTMLKRHIVLHAAGTPDDSTLRLVHAHCQRRHHAATGTSPALLPTSTPFGLA